MSKDTSAAALTGVDLPARADLGTRLGAVVDSLATVLACWSGAAFFLLSFYITYDALARYYGLPYSGITDEISSYVLGIGGVWGMAYGLKVGAHVRIDLVIGRLGPRARALLDVFAGAMTLGFAALLAWHAWGQAIESLQLDTRSITVLRAPLAIPQAMIALGYTLLAVQAAAMLARGASLGVGGDRL
jgi:TRAP-type C4-dicarboxylate transport system permease small subunit